uniref:Reverse transcriptase zinc-binding domain-containing protein n=1 Tax=Kalanchoe fedtschenkoi TaxID=63787 RepID=A0A7N0UFX9_KALFE
MGVLSDTNCQLCSSAPETQDHLFFHCQEPDDEASSLDKDVSDSIPAVKKTFLIVLFLAGSVRRDKREMFSISQKQI